MALDSRRNTAYRNGLAQFVNSDSVVLDVGAGLGIHGMIAAQLGARKVYCVEKENVINLGREIAQTNGLADRIVFLRDRIEEIQLPEPVDLIVSALTGNFLLSEDLLPVLFFARDRFLKPNGTLVPSEAVMECVPVSEPLLHQQEIASWSVQNQGIDLTAVRRYAANAMIYDTAALRQAHYLAKPKVLMQMDLRSCQEASCRSEVSFNIHTDAECHGFIGWFRIRLGDHWLSTAPHEPEVHWSAVFLPLDPPLSVNVHEALRFKLVRPAYGSWSWWAENARERRQHSTLLGEVHSASSIARSSADYNPSLNDKGHAAVLVLQCADSNCTIAEIAAQVALRFPNLYADSNKALQFVRNILYECS